ncbi:hypothetical protein MF406_05780 [Georgenia sp. TF02-10]|nr:DUF6541 family protein [Georgenia sp. TF02-10]UNX55746.1 hypothetical protein MF406_05780 [Georgenia sp. TF02-10]
MLPLLAAGAAVAGVVGAQPAGAAVLAVLLLPLLAQVTWAAAARLRRAGRPLDAAAAALVVPLAAAALVLAVYTVPQLRAMAAFPAPGGDAGEALVHGLTFATTVGWTSPWANAVVAVAVLLGAVVAVRTARARWLAAAWLLTLAVFVLAAGPETPLRALTGFWYKSADRTFAMLPTVAAVLGALGVVAVAEAAVRLARRAGAAAGTPRHARPAGAGGRPAVAVVGVILLAALVTSGGFRNGEREQGWTAWAFQPEDLIHYPYATDGEVAMLRSLDDVLPADAVVLGDPRGGAAFVQAVAGAVAYLPHVSPSSWDPEQRFLIERFGDLHHDPGVCAAVVDAGIEYFYADDSGPADWAAQAPGLHGVDTSTGFELLAEGDTARLYRLTACG